MLQIISRQLSTDEELTEADTLKGVILRTIPNWCSSCPLGMMFITPASYVQLNMNGPGCWHSLANVVVIGKEEVSFCCPNRGWPHRRKEEPKKIDIVQVLAQAELDRSSGMATLHLGLSVRRMFWSGLSCEFSYSGPFGRLYQDKQLG
jgi:hypothetical protein